MHAASLTRWPHLHRRHEMENNHNNRQEKEESTCPEPIDRERRINCRRTSESQGYCYIAMVGWMDRRERVRRNEDPCCF